MKFDKINFVLNILSSETVLSGNQNLIKLFVMDSIADTIISSVEYKLQINEGRNASIIIQDWVQLSKEGEFYQDSYTPTFTANHPIQLLVKITDTDSNIYILTGNLQGVI